MYKITVIKHCSLVYDCPTQLTKLATFSVLSLNFFLMEFMECSVSMMSFAQEKKSQQAPEIDALVRDRKVFAWCHKIN